MCSLWRQQRTKLAKHTSQLAHLCCTKCWVQALPVYPHRKVCMDNHLKKFHFLWPTINLTRISKITVHRRKTNKQNPPQLFSKAHTGWFLKQCFSIIYKVSRLATLIKIFIVRSISLRLKKCRVCKCLNISIFTQGSYTSTYLQKLEKFLLHNLWYSWYRFTSSSEVWITEQAPRDHSNKLLQLWKVIQPHTENCHCLHFSIWLTSACNKDHNKWKIILPPHPMKEIGKHDKQPST